MTKQWVRHSPPSCLTASIYAAGIILSKIFQPNFTSWVLTQSPANSVWTSGRQQHTAQLTVTSTAIAALTAEYQRIQPYIISTFPDAHTYADYALNHITTLGIRSTSRVESWNATLKGMLEVNSRTPLTVLFETLRYAVSDKDARTPKTALDDAARRLPVSQARTVEAEMSPHITYYAQNIVSAQARLTLNYKYNMVQAANPAVFEVHDRRESVSELVRIVTVTDSSMHCTCGFPTTYLLPCQHVLVINSHIFATPFRPSQVGQRWLRAYMPGVSASAALDFSPHLDAGDDVPAFSSAVASSSIDMPGRGARVGQIGGWCSTIVSFAGAHAHLYSYIARKVEGLCSEFEALVSQPAVSGTGKRTKQIARAQLCSPLPLRCIRQ